MTTHKGLKLVGNRWCSSGDLERLRRETELATNSAAKMRAESRLEKAERRCGIEREGSRVPNLDDMDRSELYAFWLKYHKPTRKAAARLIGDTRQGYMKFARWIANYAWHIRDAKGLRLGGEITNAVIAERFAQSIYMDLPSDLRW